MGALAALAQTTRLRAFRLLVEAGPSGRAAGELSAALEVPPATLSFHLEQLSHAGLVGSRRTGRRVIYHADYAAMNHLVSFLAKNCCRPEASRRTPRS